MGALTGIRVLHFAWGAVGQGMSIGLALTGAQVIKVESRRRLDFGRLLANQSGNPNKSIIFNDTCINQLGICLNLTKPKGVEIAKELVEISDIVTENFLPGTMDRLGLGYEVLRKIKPDLIMVSGSANGQKGPEAGAPGYAPLFSAIGGLGWMIGYSGGPPTEIRAVTDFLGGMASFTAIMAALLYRRETGKGQYIDVAVSEAVGCLIGDALMDWEMNRRAQSRHGNLDDVMAPHNCYRCKGEDMWVSIAVATQEEWRAFCEAICAPELAEDPRFGDPLSRWQNQAELDPIVEQWTQERTPYEVMHYLQSYGVAATPSMTAEQIYSDPHLEARGQFTCITSPEEESRIALSFPWKFSKTPLEIVEDAPRLGQHTHYVLKEILGKKQQEIKGLEEAGILF